MNKQGYVYIVSNYSRTVLYTGVTSNLERRIHQHKNKSVEGFSKKYNCTDLIWWEQGESIVAAIEREKKIKSWSRQKKDQLIAKLNPDLKDLSVALFGCE